MNFKIYIYIYININRVIYKAKLLIKFQNEFQNLHILYIYIYIVMYKAKLLIYIYIYYRCYIKIRGGTKVQPYIIIIILKLCLSKPQNAYPRLMLSLDWESCCPSELQYQHPQCRLAVPNSSLVCLRNKAKTIM